MAVVAIAAILAAVAVPSFRNMVRDSQLASATNTLVAHMALARSEAVKRNVNVVLCRSADPTAANPTCGGTAQDWSSGWLVFANLCPESPPAYSPAACGADTDMLIRVGEGVDGGLTLMANGVADAFVEYRPNGTSNMPGIATFAVCDDRGESAGRELSVSALGRSNLTKGTSDTPIASCNPA